MMRFLSRAVRVALHFVFSDTFRMWIPDIIRNLPATPSAPWTRAARDMAATALNDRRGSGMRCKGYLGRTAVMLLG